MKVGRFLISTRTHSRHRYPATVAVDRRGRMRTPRRPEALGRRDHASDFFGPRAPRRTIPRRQTAGRGRRSGHHGRGGCCSARPPAEATTARGTRKKGPHLRLFRPLNPPPEHPVAPDERPRPTQSPRWPWRLLIDEAACGSHDGPMHSEEGTTPPTFSPLEPPAGPPRGPRRPRTERELTEHD
jgi:hypothetical protein